MKHSILWRRIVPIVAALLWTMGLLVDFYRVHKPFGVEQAVAALGTLWSVIAAVAIALLGLALGHGLLRWGRFQVESPLETLVWAWGGGLGSMALVMLGIGLAGGLYRLAFFLLTPVALLVLRRDVRAVLRLFKPTWAELASWPRALRLFWGVVLVLTLTLALTPPTAWDALQYHLDGPRLYIEKHRIFSIDSIGLAYSGLTEMLFSWAMLLADDIAAQLVHWAYGVALLMILYLGGRRVSPERPWLPVALLGSVPMVLTLLPWAYNDLTLAFYQVAALMAMFRWRERGEARWAVLSGVLCGFGIGTKYTAAVIIPALALLILVWPNSWRGRMAGWLGLGLGAAAVSAPWLLRNWALWGNPVYPYLFGGRYWDHLRDEWHHRIGSGIGWNWLAILRLPWTASLGLMDVSFREARTGPFWVIALPLVLGALLWPRHVPDAERRPRAGAAAALLVFGVQFAVWTLGVIQSRALFQARLLLPTLVVFTLPTAWALVQLAQLDMSQFSLRRFMLVVLTLVLVLNLVDLTLEWVHESPLSYLAGMESRSASLTRRLGASFTTMQEINQRLSADDKVLFLWEPRGYYCRIPNQPDHILDRMRHLIALEGNAAGVARRLREQGYTHVLVFETGLAYLSDPAQDPFVRLVSESELALLAELRADYFVEIFSNGHYTLYRIKNQA